MQTSDSTKEITAALLAFHKAAIVIGKNAENAAFKSGPRGSASKYASLAHILEGIAAPLADCGLGFVQFPDEDGLTTRLLHKSGEWMQASLTMRPTQNTPQAHGSAITYAKRYALVAILGLRIDGDDDGNAASAPAPVVALATPAQRHGLTTLLNSDFITDDERAAMLPKIDAMSAGRADASAEKLRATIEFRCRDKAIDFDTQNKVGTPNPYRA